MKNPKKIKVYAVGDSTVASFDDDYYLPRYGYGTQLSQYLIPQAEVINLALSGRSSLSYLKEENYAILLECLSAGDYLIIGFGHNDEKGEDARYTNANLAYDYAGTERGVSFARNLYVNYILPARERGAIPVLCTPIVRLSENADYCHSCGHITGANGKYEGGDYAGAIRALGAAVGVTVLDLTAATMQDYKSKGFERASDYHAWAATSHGVRAGLDMTHLNMYGAKSAAYEWARLLALSDCPLREYLKPDLVPPDGTDLERAVNKDYREPQYKPFNPAEGGSRRFKAEPPWYASVMGDFGGNEHIGEFTVIQTESGFTVGNSSTVLRGKISKKTDGFAAVFMQIRADKNFTASAKAKVISLSGNDSQSAFGMMLRDDVYVDSYRSAMNGNFVAAGVVGDRALFMREGGVLTVCENPTRLRLGAEYALTITKINQQIEVRTDSFSQNFFDFDLVSTDNVYCYLCLFAARGIVAQFSDISVEITGDSVQA